MPEVIFLSLSVCEFAVLAWIAATLFTPSAKSRVISLRWPLISLFVVNTALYFAVPRWGLSILIVPAIIVLVVAWLGFSWRNIIVNSTLAAGIAATFFLLPDYLFSRKADKSAAYFVELHLFGMHAHLVRAELAQELELSAPHFDRTLLKDCLNAIDRELERSRNHPAANAPYPTLGFSPEQIIYGDSAVSLVISHFKSDPNSIRGFFIYFYLNIWRHQPVAMLHKIWTELEYYYRIPSRGLSSAPVFYESIPLLMASADISSQGGYKATLERSKSWSGYATRARDIISAPAIQHDLIGGAVEHYFSIFLLPASAFSFCGSLFVLLCRRRAGFDRPEFQLLLLSGFLAIALFGSNLTIAILHSLYPGRYLETNFTLSLITVASSILAATVIGVMTFLRAFLPKNFSPQEHGFHET